MSETLLAQGPVDVNVSRKPCNEVPPGNGYCDMCAAGHYERCRYVVPIDRVAEKLETSMSNNELHAVAQYLYQLLDDIDTAGDIAKGDDKLFRSIVERTQTKKGIVVKECDGYTVTLKPLPANK